MAELSQLKMLINLARVDGEVVEKERNYIYTIAKANGISEDVLTPLFDREHSVIIPLSLTDEKKFQYILSLVQLMKIDERLYKKEIQYCAKVASRLGYNQDAIFDLMLNVKSAETPDQIEDLKKLIAKHFQ